MTAKTGLMHMHRAVMMSVIGPVKSRYREAVQKVKEIYGGNDLLKW